MRFLRVLKDFRSHFPGGRTKPKVESGSANLLGVRHLGPLSCHLRCQQRGLCAWQGGTGKGVCPAEDEQGPAGAGMSGRSLSQEGLLPILPSCLPTPFYPLSSLSFILFLSHMLSSAVSQLLEGWGEGAGQSPFGRVCTWTPATGPVSWCLSRQPLPSTCSGCALLLGGCGWGQEGLTHVTPKPAQHVPPPNCCTKLRPWRGGPLNLLPLLVPQQRSSERITQGRT